MQKDHDLHHETDFLERSQVLQRVAIHHRYIGNFSI
jgi:hypothetical protein